MNNFKLFHAMIDDLKTELINYSRTKNLLMLATRVDSLTGGYYQKELKIGITNKEMLHLATLLSQCQEDLSAIKYDKETIEGRRFFEILSVLGHMIDELNRWAKDNRYMAD